MHDKKNIVEEKIKIGKMRGKKREREMDRVNDIRDKKERFMEIIFKKKQ